MALFDKVKAQAQQTAQQVAQRAQEASKAGQAKIDELQTKRQLDGLLRDLGQLAYAEQTGRAAPDAEEQINKILDQIKAIEAEHGPIAAS